jgi:hypothetical protein
LQNSYKGITLAHHVSDEGSSHSFYSINKFVLSYKWLLHRICNSDILDRSRIAPPNKGSHVPRQGDRHL